MTIQLELDDQTIELARGLARARNCSIEELLKGFLLRASELSKAADDPLLGMLADEPELADKITAMAMERRERPLRRSDHE
jgi:hypothetical protein